MNRGCSERVPTAVQPREDLFPNLICWVLLASVEPPWPVYQKTHLTLIIWLLPVSLPDSSRGCREAILLAAILFKSRIIDIFTEARSSSSPSPEFTCPSLPKNQWNYHSLGSKAIFFSLSIPGWYLLTSHESNWRWLLCT